MQAIQNLGLYLVSGPDFKITSKATVNAELTKGILASLWEEGQKAAAKQGCDLSIVNLFFTVMVETLITPVEILIFIKISPKR
jgi:hypothetical protein